MGIVITYEGDLDDPARVDELIADLKQRCRRIDWPCAVVDERILGQAYRYVDGGETPTDTPGVYTHTTYIAEESVDDRVRGVRIQPPGTETLVLTFNRSGRLASYRALPGRMIVEQRRLGRLVSTRTTYTNEPGYYEMEEGGWVKTTGQLESHVMIVAMLRHVRDIYASNLMVEDDSRFWETGNLGQLEASHRSMGAIISSLREQDVAKALARLAGLEDVDEVEPLDPHLRAERPRHMKDWGISAGEN